ncbi:MAG: hypothetical protein ABS81_08690 [Pseudonocardia sp. SCN 72-86]|nr:MAG: hypothetical protein ABS81_08690 [Pseudonocardia sp. SCN 72-86]
MALTDPERGIAEQLTPLIHAFDQIGKPHLVMAWLGGPTGSGRLHELAALAHDEPITHQLLDRYPQTFDLHRLRDLLVHTAVLPGRTELLDRNDVWLDTILNQAPPQHSRIVRPFATWHVFRRARQRARRRPTTSSAATWARTQTLLALQLLSWLDEQGKDLATATQADLDIWLDHGRDYRHLVRGFVTWATERRLCAELQVPTRNRSDPANIVAESDRWTLLTRCLRDEDLPLDVRAAGALVLLYGRTLTTIAQLTAADIHRLNDGTYLHFRDAPVLLPPALAAVIHAQRCSDTPGAALHDLDPQTRLLFPGRSPGRPAAAKVLARKLRQHGIEPRPARHAARSAWASEIPAPIAADLLGIHINTATKWAARARRDWTGYLAARASQRPDLRNTAPGE